MSPITSPSCLSTQIKKIVIVAADLASLNANTSIVECAKGRQRLGKEPCLHLFCNLEFLVGAAFRFQLLGNSAAFCFDLLAHFVTARKAEGVPVQIFKTGVDTTPAG